MPRSANARSRVAPLEVFTYTYQVRITWPQGGDRAGEGSNTWNFGWTGSASPLVADFNKLSLGVEAFYNTKGGTQAYEVSAYFGRAVSRAAAACSCDIFVVDPTAPDPAKLGPPISSSAFQMGPYTTEGASYDLPNQIACCLSFRADYGTDEEYGTKTRPRADDRGRVYLGPLNNSVQGVTGIGLTYMAFYPTFLTDIGTSYAAMFTSLQAESWQHCVWSRKEAVFKPVSVYAVNNHPDTLRKRASLTEALQWQIA